MLAQNAPAEPGISPVLAENIPITDSDAAKDEARQKERRLAPRSSNQFRVGPPFSTSTLGFPILSASKQPVVPSISARLDRGFDLIEGEWIGYKRNYFTLVAAFSLVGYPLSVATTESFSYMDSGGHPRRILAFKMSLTSVCLEDNSTAVTLVQHTAKRDRGPQSSPPLYYAVPGELPAHSTMKSVANIRNGEKIDRCNRLFYLSKEDHQKAVAENPTCVLATYPVDCEISLVARYERIQFSSAGCGNRKSASTNNKHYILVVQLLGQTESGSDVVLASTQSPPLIVRGRSPSNYPLTEKSEVKVEKATKLEKPLEKAVAKPCIANLICHELSDAENDENQTAQKRRKLKPVGLIARSPLGPNQNILNSYTSEALDPELLGTPQRSRSALFNLLYGKLPSEIPPIVYPAEERVREPVFAPPVDPNAGLLIAQENSFPYLEVSPTFSSYSFLSDGEPMNINHSAFQSSRDRLHKAMHEYENNMLDLDDLIDAELNSYDCYSSLPVPIAFPDTLRTSTPLQLQVMEKPMAMRPNPVRNLHPAVARCKHGFKQRTKRQRRERRYTFADLSEGEVSDASFKIFRRQLADFKSRIRDQPSPHGSSLRSSPLTMLSSDHEAFFLHGLRERGMSEDFDKT